MRSDDEPQPHRAAAAAAVAAAAAAVADGRRSTIDVRRHRRSRNVDFESGGDDEGEPSSSIGLQSTSTSRLLNSDALANEAAALDESSNRPLSDEHNAASQHRSGFSHVSCSLFFFMLLSAYRPNI